MAKKVILKNKKTGDIEYPVTTTDCIITPDNSNVATEQYCTDFVNSTPERIEVIDTLGEKLSEDESVTNAVVNTIADAKKQLFIDLWNRACRRKPAGFSESQAYIYGKYNAETGYFELNGLTDITYEQAIDIFIAGKVCNENDAKIKYWTVDIRTCLPNSHYDLNAQYTQTFANCRTLEKVKLPNVIPAQECFAQCVKLISIKGLYAINSQAGVNACVDTYRACTNLEEIEFGIVFSQNFSLQYSPKLNLKVFQDIASKYGGTSPITITVHPDVYAKLTDSSNTEWNQVLLDAQNKQITFATA